MDRLLQGMRHEAQTTGKPEPSNVICCGFDSENGVDSRTTAWKQALTGMRLEAPLEGLEKPVQPGTAAESALRLAQFTNLAQRQPSPAKRRLAQLHSQRRDRQIGTAPHRAIHQPHLARGRSRIASRP